MPALLPDPSTGLLIFTTNNRVFVYSEGPKTTTRGGEWEPKISFDNNWLLSQNHHQIREQNIVMSTTQLVGGCSLETQWDTTNKHEARTKPRDEKRDTQLL
jgi:hypothetical protein